MRKRRVSVTGTHCEQPENQFLSHSSVIQAGACFPKCHLCQERIVERPGFTAESSGNFDDGALLRQGPARGRDAQDERDVLAFGQRQLCAGCGALMALCREVHQTEVDVWFGDVVLPTI